MSSLIKSEFERFSQEISEATQAYQWKIAGKKIADLQYFLKLSIWEAVGKGELESVRLLIGLGADVNELYGVEYGPALVHEAASKGHAEVLKLLIDKGAKVFVKDTYRSKKTPLDLAIEKGHMECQKILEENGFLDGKFMDCIVRGVSKPLHQMIKKGVNINSQIDGLYPLAAAAACKNVEAFEVLLAAGADPTKPDPDPETKKDLLHMAADFFVAKNTVEIFKRLIDAKLPVNNQDRAGNTPLHLVCEKYRFSSNDVSCFSEEMVSSLISAGANVHVKNNSNKTPLHCACASANLKLAQLLLAQGADMDCHDKENRTPLECVPHRYVDEFKACFERHKMSIFIPDENQTDNEETAYLTVSL